MNLFQPPNTHFRFPRLPHLPDIRNVAQIRGRGSPMESSAITLVRRVPDSASSSSSSSTPCTSGASSDTCQKPTDTSGTIPIVLGIVIPLTAAIIAFIILHRRYKKKLRAEDQADEEKYRSMDFGMDLAYNGKKGKKGGPEMRGMEPGTPTRNMKGLSLEAGASPYIFPNGRNSVDSMASLARSGLDADHRYGIVGKGDDMSIRSPTPRARRDTESTAAGSTGDASNAGLLGHAQAFPKSIPPRAHSLPDPSEPPMIQEPEKAMLASSQGYSPPQAKNNGGLAPILPDIPRDSYIDQSGFRQSNNYLGSFIHSGEPSMIDEKPSPLGSKVDSTSSTLLGSDSSLKVSVTEIVPTPDGSLPVTAPAPRPSPADKALPNDPRDKFQSMQGSIHDANSASFAQNSNTNSFTSEFSSYGETPFKVTPPSPHDSHASRDSASTYATIPPRGQSLAAPLPEIQEHRESAYLGDSMNDMDYNPQRLSVLMRPLPPDDPTENPEERANRIRSFYKEYFDDSKPFQAPPPLPEQSNPNEYYEDYDTGYLGDAYGVYDNQSGGFVVGGAPFAQPVTRRAMTPPPRAPPRFRGRSSSSAASQQPPPRGMSSMSNYHSRGPMSERGRSATRKPMPPPQPLISLKTPHLLKDDSALYSAFDLAPPPSYRDRQNGRRPDSPLGVERPYSPSVRAHVPLNTAYEELNTMPSPHLLRKSGTFTALDFAPPTRLRNTDSGSDAGSVRSGRSGVSAAQVYAIRNGAHRISRIPKDLAGTKDDIMASLKPNWSLNY